jgi:hypothetical protein
MTFKENYETKKEVNNVEHPYFAQSAHPEVIALHGAPLRLEAL